MLSASLDRYIGGSLDPTLWLQNPRSMPLHQLVAQHRVQRTLSGDTVVEFILCMKRLLSCHGDLQHSCILCKKLLPTRWMIILCEGCEHILIGGGGRDTLSPSGIQILCLLHRMVEDIHRRRLSGSTRTPSVMVDAISEGMVLAVIAGTDTGSNWWLREPMVIMEAPSGGGPPDGPPLFPPIAELIVALLVLQLAPPLRLSGAVEPHGLLAFLRLCDNRSRGELLAPISGTLHSLIRLFKHELKMMMLMLMLKRMLMM